MDRRMPTVAEQVQLARDAVAYLTQYMPTDSSGEAYAVAYRSMDGVGWLQDQSRAGIAALAASCWRLGVQPYAEFSPDDLDAAEQHRAHPESFPGKAQDAH